MIKVKLLRPGVIVPKQATMGAAGYDLRWHGERTQLMTNRYLFDTGISMEIPPGFVGLITPRSGHAIKHGITVSNSPGVIDSDYRGEIKVCLEGGASLSHIFFPGDRIAQLLIMPLWTGELIEVQENLSVTDRNSGGFGSTGK